MKIFIFNSCLVINIKQFNCVYNQFITGHKNIQNYPQQNQLSLNGHTFQFEMKSVAGVWTYNLAYFGDKYQYNQVLILNNSNTSKTINHIHQQRKDEQYSHKHYILIQGQSLAFDAINQEHFYFQYEN
ncbi:unnamed protein product [Paramecium primaurelia]|uniref:Uncharacterized protein n=1 Tax=Paramecium primaurelia TaxID=5886 RepID=A0A8S1PEY8_PARPR|nr:unnamed protein product [Paramecium primaurelia]